MENKYISKRYWSEPDNAMAECDVMAKSFDDVINLSLGDPDLVTDKSIIDAAYEAMLAGHTGYSDFQGDPELRDEIRKFYKEEYGMDIRDEEVMISSSATVAMYLAFEAILNDGDEVILQAPFFSPYPHQVVQARGVPVELGTYEEEDFQISIERLESLITDRTRAIVINTPNNPTGSCLTLETMQGIARIAEKYDLIVIADDIYTDYSYENPFIPFASLPGMFPRTITLNSFSKGFNMTGWRVGHIVAPEYFIKTIQRINDGVCFTTPTMSQRAAIYALQHRREIQPPIIEEYKARVTYAARRINQIPGWHVIEPPKGTFYLFPSIKGTGLSSKEVVTKVLQEAHVLALPGETFGACGAGHIRIACTTNIDVLREAFDRIDRIKW